MLEQCILAAAEVIYSSSQTNLCQGDPSEDPNCTKHRAAMKKVFVTGGFDDLRSRQVRFLEAASQFGELHVLVWADEVINELNGKPPKFPLAERIYLLQGIRYISNVTVWKLPVKRDTLPYPNGTKPMCGS